MIPLPVYLPELILIAAAGVLMLLGVSTGSGARRIAPVIALLTLVLVFFYQLPTGMNESANPRLIDPTHTFLIGGMATYIKMIAAGVGVLFVLLSWPNNSESTANPAMSIGADVCEYFALMLVSISGIFLVAGANDIILLFLGIELASMPTYVMVSISRPLPVAQEAGVKYFFLGAMAAALMLFGFSYLYGTTGLTNITQLAAHFAAGLDHNHPTVMLSPWQLLAAVMIIVGFAFKMAAVPLHFYAADVYQGAATPVTALLSFVPKTSGFIALVKVLYALGAGTFAVSPPVVRLLWVLAVLTMSFGNVLGLLQANVKRVLAYSSVAHSGYMLVGITAMVSATGSFEARQNIQEHALAGVLFYLAAYGIMNAGAFGVMMLLPARPNRQFGEAFSTSASLAGKHPDLPPACAETYEDLAGTGRTHVGLGLMMAVSCFSLIGLPLTVGFFAKLLLISPALRAGDNWLVVATVINAAIGAAYYLKIVGTMFLRSDADPSAATASAASVDIHHLSAYFSFPTYTAVVLSTVGTLFFGIILPATNNLNERAIDAAAPMLPMMSAAPSADAPRAVVSMVNTSGGLPSSSAMAQK